jgi:hypothetical protein
MRRHAYALLMAPFSRCPLATYAHAASAAAPRLFARHCPPVAVRYAIADYAIFDMLPLQFRFRFSVADFRRRFMLLTVFDVSPLSPC